MEVILRQDIPKLGHRGDIVNVADGYARNYLLPKRLAVPATEANKKIVEQERLAYLRREAKLREEAQELAKLLVNVELKIPRKAGEEGQLFGSVTAQDIVEELRKLNYHIDRKKIELEHPIKQVGEFTVPIRLHKDVMVEIKVKVLREGEEEEAKVEKTEEQQPKAEAAAGQEATSTKKTAKKKKS